MPGIPSRMPGRPRAFTRRAGYLEIIRCRRETFGTHFVNVKTGERLGLDLLYAIVSDKDDFDRTGIGVVLGGRVPTRGIHLRRCGYTPALRLYSRRCGYTPTDASYAVELRLSRSGPRE